LVQAPTTPPAQLQTLQPSYHDVHAAGQVAGAWVVVVVHGLHVFDGQRPFMTRPHRQYCCVVGGHGAWVVVDGQTSSPHGYTSQPFASVSLFAT
jgi:hypothetical protein